MPRTHFLYEPNRPRAGGVGFPLPLKKVREHHTNLMLLQVTLKRGKLEQGELTMLLAEMGEAEDKRDRWAHRCDPDEVRQAMQEITASFRPYM